MVNILHLLNVSVGNWEVRVQPVGHAPVEEVVEVLQVRLVVEPVDRGLYCTVLYCTVLYCTCGPGTRNSSGRNAVLASSCWACHGERRISGEIILRGICPQNLNIQQDLTENRTLKVVPR